jgi:hypothetical protein
LPRRPDSTARTSPSARLARLLLAAAVAAGPLAAAGQTAGGPSALPEAPSATLGLQAAALAAPQTPQAAGVGTIFGDVIDSHDGLVPGATVSATQLNPAPGTTAAAPVEVISDDAGHFELRLPAGAWTITVTAPELSRFVSPREVIHPNERRELQGVVLSIAATHADVTVTMTIEQVAQQEIHDQEHQRVLAVFPNYNTSYVWNAAPMTARQKFALSLHATFDPVSFATAAGIAEWQQIRNTYPEYGGGWEGYGKRYGAAWATTFIGHNIGYAVLPSVFHQDPRYFWMGTGTVKVRATHAILSSVLCRGNNGHTQFNASHMFGNFIAGIISKAYYPQTNSYATLAVNNMILGTLGTSGVNLVREFVIPRFSKGTPQFGKGKPEKEAAKSAHP